MEVIHEYTLPSELLCTFDVFVRFNRLYYKLIGYIIFCIDYMFKSINGRR